MTDFRVENPGGGSVAWSDLTGTATALLLDQTTPQQVTGGKPEFRLGFDIGDITAMWGHWHFDLTNSNKDLTLTSDFFAGQFYVDRLVATTSVLSNGSINVDAATDATIWVDRGTSALSRQAVIDFRTAGTDYFLFGLASDHVGSDDFLTIKGGPLGNVIMDMQASTGNVGIGVTSPSYPLHVVGNQYLESGNLGLGAVPYTYGAAGDEYTINTSRTFTDTTASAFKGSYIGEIYWNPSVASVLQYVRGLTFSVNSVPGDTANNTGYFEGVEASALWRSDGTLASCYGLVAKSGTFVGGGVDSTGTITNASAIYAYVTKTTSSTITNAYGLNIPFVYGTNAYGVYINGVSGSSNAYDIYANDSGAYNYFAGRVGIGTASPGYTLDVSGNANASGTITSNTLQSQYIVGLTTIGLIGDTIALWSNRLNLQNSSGIVWSSNSNFYGTPDISLSRFAANKLAVGNGTLGDSSGTLIAGNVGIGTTAPTAALHLKAGTATASTAPLKFTSGTLLGTAEAGAVEFVTDDFYGTITTGPARQKFVLSAGLAINRIPYSTTNGRLTDNANFSFDTTNGLNTGSYNIQTTGDVKGATYHVGTAAGVDTNIVDSDGNTYVFTKGILTQVVPPGGG